MNSNHSPTNSPKAADNNYLRDHHGGNNHPPLTPVPADAARAVVLFADVVSRRQSRDNSVEGYPSPHKKKPRSMNRSERFSDDDGDVNDNDDNTGADDESSSSGDDNDARLSD